MKIAILSVTVKGAVLAAKLSHCLACETVVFAKEGRTAGVRAETFSSLGELVKKNFTSYDGLVFIMATGIVVRVIAPLLGHKTSDPAVVVVDDGGNYAISLLSGHIGGANELTQVVAQAIGAVPVITTATDVAGKIAPDVLSGKLGAAIEPFDQLKIVNAAMANGQKVEFFLDTDLLQADVLREKAARFGISLSDFHVGTNNDQCRDADAAVLITDKQVETTVPHVFLRPPTLVVGVGCRRGTACETILSAIAAACAKIGRSKRSICQIVSVDVKQDEEGLLLAGQQLGAELNFFDRQQLQQCIDKHKLCVSNFVQEQIGVGNVCEAAALLGAQNSQLILGKTKFQQVTVAIAEAKFML